MKRVLLLATILLVASVSAYAQDEYRRFELAGMFNLERADMNVLGHQIIYGYGASAQVNANKHIGVVAEWSDAHGSFGPEMISQGGTTYEIPLGYTRIQTILAGLRVYHRKRVFNLFAHLMAGAGKEKIDYNFGSYATWQFAFGLGGGVDLNLGERFAIRAVQIDWLPIRADLQLEGAGSFFSNWRYQGGLVFKF